MSTLKERFEKLPRDLHCKNALNEAYVLQFVRQELLALAEELENTQYIKEARALIRSKADELV